ncbi:MAG: hypothetical protein AAF184_10425 [Pseudomonadota bacterium]
MGTPTTSAFRRERNEYGPNYDNDYLTLYSDYVASADRISDRRQLANSFFLTANTALLALTGYFSEDGDSLIWLAAFAGILFSFTWRRLITAYRNLNAAKFDVINQLEQRLPFAAYEEEWVRLKQREAGHGGFSTIESIVPATFMMLHGAVFMFSAVRWIQMHTAG